MGEIVEFSGETYLDIPPQRVLSAALEADLDLVVVIGWDKKSRLFRASSAADVAEQLMLLELYKTELLKAAIEE